MKNILKKSLFLLCFIVLFTVFPSGVFAAEKDLKIILNGSAANFSAMSKPIIVNGRTLVSASEIKELLNKYGTYDFSWDENDMSVTFKSTETTIKLWSNKNEAEVDGKKVSVDSTVVLKDEVVYIPLRFVAENFGFIVNWDYRSNVVGIMDQQTLEKVSGLIQKYQDSMASAKKISIEMNADVGVQMDIDGVPSDINMNILGFVNQDIENKFMYMYQEIKSVSQEDGLLPENMIVEIYDDGVNSYTNDTESPGKYVKTESLFSMINNLAQQMNSQYDFTAAMELEKSSYAGMINSVDQNGNIVWEGSIAVPDNLLKEAIDGALSVVGVDSSFFSNIDLSIPSPIQFKYTFDKTTNDIVSISASYIMIMNMSIEENQSTHFVYDYNINMPKIDINPDFESVVPDSVKQNAVYMDISGDSGELEE